MKRHITKHTPSLLFAALLVVQIIFLSAEQAASAQPIPLPTSQPLLILPQSTDDPIPTDEPYPTEEPTEEPTFEVTPTETLTPTLTETATLEVTATPTFTETYTVEPTLEETATATSTETLIPTFTDTATFTPTWTETFTATPTYTDTVAPTLTETASPTLTSTWTETFTATPTYTDTLTPTLTETASPTLTPTWTEAFTATPTHTAAATNTWTPSPFPTLIPSSTWTPVPPTPTNTPTFTPTPYAPDCTYNIAPGDVYGTQGLVWAVNQANTSSNADIICLGVGSTYSLTQAYEYSSGLPPIRTPITIRGYNATLVRSLSARGLGEFRLLYVDSTGILQIENVTMIGGRSPQGGAIISAGTLTVQNSLLDNNTSTSSGGGIYIASGTATITNTTIQNNRSMVGGGIYTTGSNITSITLNNVILTNNQATNTGGGLFNFNANVYINNSQFIGNIAPEGAGIRNQVFGLISISNSIIRGNNASIYGGGLVTDTRAITASNNCFVNNVSPVGSSVYTPITGGTALNFEFNWWGRSTGTVPGEIYGNIDPVPPLTTPPANCKTLVSR
jgi:hypothetical protein